MKSKLKEHFRIWNFHPRATWWNECSCIQLLLQLYFNNVLQSTEEGCSWLGKIKIIETAEKLIKSGVLAVTPDGSLNPSSADMPCTNGGKIVLHNINRIHATHFSACHHIFFSRFLTALKNCTWIVGNPFLTALTKLATRCLFAIVKEIGNTWVYFN